MRRGRKEKKRKREKSETRERLKERGISVANCRRELPSQTSSKCRGSHEKIHTYMRDDAHPALLTVHRNDDSLRNDDVAFVDAAEQTATRFRHGRRCSDVV